jgi:hypothetical protein
MKGTFIHGVNAAFNGILSTGIKTNTKSVAFSPQVNYTDLPSDRRLSAKLVPTLADRGFCVVSATNPHNR